MTLPDPPKPLVETISEITPARILVGRSGVSYRSKTHLQLRNDHAFARDAVWKEFDLQGDLPKEFVEHYHLFEVQTQAKDKTEYLRRPDLGRRIDSETQAKLIEKCSPGVDLQIVLGDGLSATAVKAQIPSLVPLLETGAKNRGWSFGQVFLVRYCRVGILNAIGESLHPSVVVLLIGERPGLATAESLSAYMAYRPQNGHTDANRNLISNIHASGISYEEASARILDLAKQMRAMQTSGVAVKERWSQNSLGLPDKS
jgi:ethanolamine ammonia-lyase small subunit